MLRIPRLIPQQQDNRSHLLVICIYSGRMGACMGEIGISVSQQQAGRQPVRTMLLVIYKVRAGENALDHDKETKISGMQPTYSTQCL